MSAESKTEGVGGPGVPVESAPLSEEEEELLKKLKEYFADKDYEEIPEVMYIKFVRGYWHEEPRLEKTIEIMEKALKFRKEHEVTKLAEEKADAAETYRVNVWPYHVHGVDKQGHPIYFEQTGKVDPVTLLNKHNLEDVRDFHLVMMEKMEKLKADISKKSGKLTYKHIVVLDLNGLGYKHCSKKFSGQIQATIDIDQFFYPESLFHLYIINVPFVFKALWAVVKAWVDPITRERISVLRSGFKEEILKLVDEDQLPNFYGGKCAIPDCKTCANDEFKQIDIIQKA